MDLINSLLSSPIYLRGLVGVVLAAALSGVISLLIRYTQTQFLAIESLHMILAAAATGYLVNIFVPSIYPEALAYLVMALFVLLMVYLSVKGYEQNTSIAVIAFIAAAVSSLASYGLAIYSPTGPSVVYNILFGSPFFLRETDLVVSAFSLVVFVVVIAFTWRRILLLSFDPEYFAFIKGSLQTLIHRTLIYIIIASSAIYLTRLVGAIAAHILFIAPSVTPFVKRVSVINATLTIIIVSIISLLISIVLNLPFGGVLGLISIFFYAAPSLIKRSS